MLDTKNRSGVMNESLLEADGFIESKTTAEFPFATAVSEVSDPLTWTAEKDALMLQAVREMCLFHSKNNRVISELYRRNGFSPESLQKIEDIQCIPVLGVTAMKYHLITSLPHETAVLKLTSSGTRGQKTQIWFDQKSLDRVQRMLDVYLEQEGMVSSVPTNYIVFSYDPADAKDLGVAYSEENQLRFAPVKSVYFALKKNAEGEWHFDLEAALAILLKFASEEEPTRVFGMPAFIFGFLEFLKAKKKSVSLPEGSLMITGGGWKAAEDKSVTRERFREMCTQAFGIPSHWQRDAYGMAEHCAPYFHCKHNRFHIPAYNRLLIRDPKTFEVVENGEIGLLELVTPFNAMMPTTALLSTDLASIDVENCTCGWNSPTFTLHGRAGISKHKGCALHAEDIVKRGKSK
jgi:phenylacetate-coenzyme A ligase PaaK-like adenylate-forming protein